VNSGIWSSMEALGWSLNWTISVIGWDMVDGGGIGVTVRCVCVRLAGGGAVRNRMGGLLVVFQ
jgi:hypothetical protein